METRGAKGLDYGEIGRLCAAQKIGLTEDTPKEINGWNPLLLAYAKYKKEVDGVSPEQLLKTWGTPDRHHNWFKRSMSQANDYIIVIG